LIDIHAPRSAVAPVAHVLERQVRRLGAQLGHRLLREPAEADHVDADDVYVLAHGVVLLRVSRG
jgi:hypothetical protein